MSQSQQQQQIAAKPERKPRVRVPKEKKELTKEQIDKLKSDNLKMERRIATYQAQNKKMLENKTGKEMVKGTFDPRKNTGTDSYLIENDTNYKTLRGLVYRMVDTLVNPDSTPPFPWPTSQVQQVSVLATKSSEQLSEQNFCPDAVIATLPEVAQITKKVASFPIPTGTNPPNANNCYIVMPSNGPSSIYGVTSPVLKSLASVDVGLTFWRSIVPTDPAFLPFNILQPSINKAFSIVGSGTINLTPNKPSYWNWDLKDKNSEHFVVPAGNDIDGTTAFAVNTTRQTDSTVSIATCGTGIYPADMMIHIAGYNLASGLSFTYSAQLSSLRTALEMLTDTFVNHSGGTDILQVWFESASGGNAEIDFEISFFSILATGPIDNCGAFTAVAFPRTASHLQWRKDTNFDSNSIDSCAVTASSILVSNDSPNLTINGSVISTYLAPNIGYGDVDGTTLNDKIAAYKSTYYKGKAKNGLYTYLPCAALPYKMLGTDNRHTERGMALIGLSCSEGGQDFFVNKCQHYIFSSSSQLFLKMNPVYNYMTMTAISKALLNSACASENPDHLKFAADILRKSADIVKTEAFGALLEMIGSAAPRVSSALKTGAKVYPGIATGAADLLDQF